MTVAGPETNRARIDRSIRVWSTLLLGVMALLVPALYAIFAVSGHSRSLKTEAYYLSRQVEKIIQDRPDLWEYETLRLREIAAQLAIEKAPTSRQIFSSAGHLLAENQIQALPPRLRVETPIFESGRVVAKFVAERSLRTMAVRLALIAFLSQVLALAGVMLFRALPMRFIDHLLAELGREKQRSEAILNAIQEGVVAVDAQGSILLMNPVAEELLGIRNQEALGFPLQRVFPVALDLGPEPAMVRKVQRSEDGTAHTLEIREFPIALPDSAAAGKVVLFRDITEKEKAEAEVLRSRQVDSLGVLAGGIAHNFNNFLGTILGNISLAKEVLGAGNEAESQLDKAIQATRHARQVSNRLLAFAKGSEPSRTILEVPPLVQEAADFALQGSCNQLSVVFDPDLACIEGDAGLITQVIHNLVLNAGQAMSGGGFLLIRGTNAEVAEAQIPHVSAGRYVVLRVEDSGPGIPEGIRERIFEPYFTTKLGGSGLGLASAYKIMKAHGGNIFATSSSLGGACFVLYFPATEQHAPQRRPDPPQAGLGRGERILVMDDDPVLLSTCQGILEHYGFEVSTAPEGRRAAAVYERALEAGRPFDAVILDLIIVGGLGGKETAELILARNPGALILVSSGYSDDPVVAKPNEFGFAAALSKPYSAPELLAALRGMLDAAAVQSGSDQERPTKAAVPLTRPGSALKA